MNPLLLALLGACVFVAGFTFGLALGLVIRKLPREAAMQVRDIKAWGQKRQMSLLGVFLILMAGLTYQSQRESGGAVDAVRAQSACLTTYANQLYDSLTPRQKAAEALQNADKRFKKADQVFAEALGTLLSDAIGGTASEETRTQDAVDLQRATEAKARALAHANAVADRLSRKRAQNPYPAPPKEACPK